jgi:hypothetical protein
VSQQLLALQVTNAANQAGLQPLRAGLDLDALQRLRLGVDARPQPSRIFSFSVMKAPPT